MLNLWSESGKLLYLWINSIEDCYLNQAVKSFYTPINFNIFRKKSVQSATDQNC